MNIDEIKNLAASFVVNKNKFDRLPEIKFHDSSSGKRFLLFFFFLLNESWRIPGRNGAKEEAYVRRKKNSRACPMSGIRGTHGERNEFCDTRLRGLFKSRRAPRFFPMANSSGSGATVLSEPVFSSGRRYGRHSMPVVYSASRGEESRWERFVVRDCARGCFATFRSLDDE